MTNKIFVGEVEEQYFGTPIDIFKEAIGLYTKRNEDFEVYTNNPQFVEALEVLCGENNIDIYIILDGVNYEVSFQKAYDYLGDVYDIINSIRFSKTLKEEEDDYYSDITLVFNDIKEYEDKWSLSRCDLDD